MAAAKRKADHAAAAPARKEKDSPNDRSAKRQRKSDAASQSIPAKTKPETSSIFKDEEKSFPRGGASVLTPLEHKQIQIKATQDVLFEQAGHKREADDGLSEQGSDAGEHAPKASKKRKSKKSKTVQTAEEEEKVKVESLTFKNLAIGTLVLGQIVDITAQDIVLALPNGLIGYVPITAISDKLNERIEKLLKDEDESESEKDGEDEGFEDIDLKAMFSVGQYLRACVTSTTGDGASGKAGLKPKIELSIHPRYVNRGLAKSNLIANCMIQASVVSNEDHGLVMDLGLEEQSLKGFLGKNDLSEHVEYAKAQEGTVFLCLVSGINPGGRIVKLLADHQRAGSLKKGNTLTEAPTIDVFLPGTAVDLLITALSENTLNGKLLGLIDATADIVHSGAAEKATDLAEKYKTGMKVKARIIYTLDETKKVGVSLLDHVLTLSSRMSGKPKEKKNPLDIVPVSSIIDEAKVVKVEPVLGVYLDVGVRDVVGFAPISKLADDRVDTPSESSGPFRLASTHKARIIGYSAFDGMFRLSLEEKVLAQPFLRVQDIQIGQVVKGQVEKLLASKDGSTTLLVQIGGPSLGTVSEMHLSDVHLQHPERKFREGSSITARVLSTDVQAHKVRLTLKKSLVNSDVEPWHSYSQLSVGDTGPGTLVNVKPGGALVEFYGNLRAWLPAAEMSEAFVADATRHFTKGQVVNVRIISFNPEENRMLVSCKDPNAVDAGRENTFRALALGDIVNGYVVEKGVDSVTVDLGQSVKGVLRIGQLTDGSEKKDKSTMTKIRVGGPLNDLVVLYKHSKSRTVTLSNKPSLRKAAQAKTLVTKFEDISEGSTVHGFVRALLPDKVFVEFAGGVSGVIFKSQLLDEMVVHPGFGLRKDQSITARVSHVVHSKQLFWLSMKPESGESATKSKKQLAATAEATIDPVDENIKSTADIEFGTTLDVRVRSAKNTQINVTIAENVRGRIHIAEMFNGWDEIKDKKHPHLQFQGGEILRVKAIGLHDARNYRFLPLTHRGGKNTLYELTNRTDVKDVADLLTMDKLKQGDSFVAFINNIADRFVYVNITANVRGRIDFFDLTDDLSLLSDIEENFPVGCALRVQVKAVDVASGRLDLTATSTLSAKSLALKDLTAGLRLPARVTKLHDSHIVVQINENIAGPIYLEQLADDFDQALPSNFKVGDYIRVCVTYVDPPNKKISMSARPSKVLSSSLPIKDPDIKGREELKEGQVVRGFIKNVADNAMYVRLGNVDVMVPKSHLSDVSTKDWRSQFKVDQLVRGKIISNDEQQKYPLLSLKKSVIEGEYVKPVNFRDLRAGEIVTCSVRHVEDYGVFLVVDKSNNVSGLCHRSNLADKPVEKEKTKELYKEGDAVKAKIIQIDVEKRRIGFSLKYSDVQGQQNDEDEEMEDVSDVSVDDENISGEELDSDNEEMRSIKSADEDNDDDEDDQSITEDNGGVLKPSTGLSTAGFDWTGAALDFGDNNAASDEESDGGAGKRKKKHKKPTIKEDLTGNLDAFGPQSVADYERLVLGQPNSAELWVRYMMFQRDLNEVEKARQIARRALVTINPREEKERLDVWTALLHLENEVGSDDSVDGTFKEACQNNDPRETHERMLKLYISSNKLDKADKLYQAMTKNKSFTPDPAFWLSYASFLMNTYSPPSPERARALLERATQSVSSSQHRHLTQKFASLEFKSPNGEAERGRTFFAGLIETWPKKWDIWDVYLSLEMSHGDEENVRALFEKMSKADMKKRRAEIVFRRWKEWEESLGNAQAVKNVNALEIKWNEKREENSES